LLKRFEGKQEFYFGLNWKFEEGHHKRPLANETAYQHLDDKVFCHIPRVFICETTLAVFPYKYVTQLVALDAMD
jgi:hypothetical protein